MDHDLVVSTGFRPLSTGGPTIGRYTAEVQRTAYSHFRWVPATGHRRRNLFTEWVIDELEKRHDTPAGQAPFFLPCAPDTIPTPATAAKEA